MLSWTISSVIFIGLALAFLLKNVTKSGWLTLHRKYPLSKKELKDEHPHFNYHTANINGIHYRNSLYSLINERGVFLKKPFPFSLFLKPIFISWANIKELKLINSVRDETDVVSNILNKFTLNQFAKIQFFNSENDFIIIKWKDEYSKKTPPDKISK